MFVFYFERGFPSIFWTTSFDERPLPASILVVDHIYSRLILSRTSPVQRTTIRRVSIRIEKNPIARSSSSSSLFLWIFKNSCTGTFSRRSLSQRTILRVSDTFQRYEVCWSQSILRDYRGRHHSVANFVFLDDSGWWSLSWIHSNRFCIFAQQQLRFEVFAETLLRE